MPDAVSIQIKRMRMEILKDINDESKDELFQIKLDDAKNIALGILFPFDITIENLPTRYTNWQTRCAIELYQRLGDEGLKSYSENGLSYSYDSGNISEGLINELIPKAGVITNEGNS